MTVKKTARLQYQRIVDSAVSHAVLRTPTEGWMRTMRKALGMSGAQLARKIGVTRARIAQAEKAERDGGVTLKSMQSMAEAMGCRFVYAIVPPDHVEDIIMAQARKKALAVVSTASKHMALENQALSNEKIEQEVARLTRDIAQDMPPDFWTDK